MDKKLINRFVLKMDELNIIAKSIIDGTSTKDVDDILEQAYVEGFLSGKYILGGEEEIDAKDVQSALNQKYEGIDILSKAKTSIQSKDITSLVRLLESEYHRMYNQGSLDYAKKNKSQGEKIYKTWVAIIDEKTRDTHLFLNGTKVPLDAYFYSYDGDKALIPGGFSSASNNVNCRCILDYTQV